MEKDFNQIASDEQLQKTAEALKANGMQPIIVANAEEAKQKALELIPENAKVMNMTSVTLDTTDISNEILNSGNYQPVRKELETAEGARKRELGAAPDYTIGSVHAITEEGHVLIASNTGSQLPAYAYGAEKVIWVVGTQKLVENLDRGLKRIYDYVLPLEDARAQKAYGKGSYVSKVLIVNREIVPDRITIILVKENLGF